MHKFSLYEDHKQYFSPKIIALVTKLYQYKGRQDLFVEIHGKKLEAFAKTAKIQSAGASNRLSGITTAPSRLEELLTDGREPKKSSEEEIAGYHRILSSILQSYDYIPNKPYYILQLHRDLYSFSRTKIGGEYKSLDTIPKGNFRPVKAFDTERAMDDLFDSYDSAFEHEDAEPLILIPMMLLDFLCIHPFKDGTERMSRLLAVLNFCKHGFFVGKYISLEVLMEKSPEEFNGAFMDSAFDWHDNGNSYEAFICYFLKLLTQSYAEFENRIAHLKFNEKSKPDLIEKYVIERNGKITKKDILQYFPDVSEITVERTLHDLCKKGMIKKQGASRATFYVPCI